MAETLDFKIGFGSSNDRRSRIKIRDHLANEDSGAESLLGVLGLMLLLRVRRMTNRRFRIKPRDHLAGGGALSANSLLDMVYQLSYNGTPSHCLNKTHLKPLKITQKQKFCKVKCSNINAFTQSFLRN